LKKMSYERDKVLSAVI